MKLAYADVLVETAQKPMKARLMLGEIRRTSVLMFTERDAAIGGQVAVVMHGATENPLYLKATVTSCARTEMRTRVIKEVPMRFRMELNFLFDDAKSEQEFGRYYEHLQKLRK